MTYAIVDLLWAKSHGIEILPEMRTSVDQSKVILHEEMLLPFSDEDFPRYSFSDSAFIELLNSNEWTYPDGEEPVINRDFSRVLALNVFNKEITKDINTYNFTAEEALIVKDYYPEWEIGIDVKTGERYRFDNTLWECIQDHTTQENWKPTNSASLYKRVDEEHKGTIDDPIPYNNNMELFKDKYYIQDNIIYRCTRNTETPVYNKLSDLVGIYVEKV